MLMSSLGWKRECIERAGGCAQVPLGQMQIDGSYFEVAMTEQYLDGAQVGTGFEKMCGKAMTKCVGMDAPVIEASSFGSNLAGRP